MGWIMLLAIIIPLADMYLLIKLGGFLGFWPTVLAVICTGIIGVKMAKRQGIYTLTRIQQELASGGIPGNQVLDGVLILSGALLLFTPGFITDLAGILLLLPPSRGALRELLKIKLRKMMEQGSVNVFYRKP